MFDETTRKRLRWHSRRGMWELDVLLLPFFDEAFDQLDDAGQLDYQRLINCEDQELFMWLMKREPVSDPSLQSIVDRIVGHARTHAPNPRPV